MAANSNLHAAKAAKNDEFYTRYEDINAEINTLEHGYRPHFKDAVVYCNCDDPEWSNFWKFFKDRFQAFGLKKLISTHYEKDGSSSYMLEFDGAKVTKAELEGNGDFRSEECIELLKQADIVVTNPPFSLFREYVAQLMEYGKKFIIIGSKNIITYKEIFPLLKDNEMWVGAKPMSGSLWFQTPEGFSSKFTKVADDEALTPIPCCWFTNLDIPKRHEPMKLGQCYYGYEERYPKYNNYDAINVDKTAEIPGDYDGVMGVPITFMDKFCPEQFEIIGMAEDNGRGYSGELAKWDGKNPHCVINGKNKFKRIFIRRKKGST